MKTLTNFSLSKTGSTYTLTLTFSDNTTATYTLTSNAAVAVSCTQPQSNATPPVLGPATLAVVPQLYLWSEGTPVAAKKGK